MLLSVWCGCVVIQAIQLELRAHNKVMERLLTDGQKIVDASADGDKKAMQDRLNGGMHLHVVKS